MSFTLTKIMLYLHYKMILKATTIHIIIIYKITTITTITMKMMMMMIIIQTTIKSTAMTF